MADSRTDAEQSHNSPSSSSSEPQKARSPSQQDGGAGVSDDRKHSESSRKETAATRDVDHTVVSASDPPLPTEEAPPLPNEAPPEDDGWTFQWDSNARAYYFYNTLTGKSQWENPRVPEASATGYGSSATPLATSSGAPGTSSPPKRKYGGYNPAIHGDYDPNADYAKEAEKEEEEAEVAAAVAAGLPNPNGEYGLNAHFNRFTGRFQQAGINPEIHNDENKSKRQMTAFFDVDAAANSHDGRSLKAERRNKALSKKELKAFKEKRREKKEEKRRAWLRD